jgi:hypothetical protein
LSAGVRKMRVVTCVTFMREPFLQYGTWLDLKLANVTTDLASRASIAWVGLGRGAEV